MFGAVLFIVILRSNNKFNSIMLHICDVQTSKGCSEGAQEAVGKQESKNTTSFPFCEYGILDCSLMMYYAFTSRPPIML